MKILQINTTVNAGSTGTICEEIGRTIQSFGHESAIACARVGKRGSQSRLFKIGNTMDHLLHVAHTRFFDRTAFASSVSTRSLIAEIRRWKPDIIQLHNLHGYYINVELLFNFLRDYGAPVVWTLHDCWAFTGHCTYFDSVNCVKWKTHCRQCPKTTFYPSSFFIDNSFANYRDKQAAFGKLGSMMIVTPSQWLANCVSESFLKQYPVRVIHNGIDLDMFNPSKGLTNTEQTKPTVLGVANVWDARKGLKDFMHLAEVLKGDAKIILVGLDDSQINQLPAGVVGIKRTDKVEDLAALYAAATVFVNPTYQDNFPTTNIEALASGTPVITYNTGGSPEALELGCGFVVEKGDTRGLAEKVKLVLREGKKEMQVNCRERAVNNFNKVDRYTDYVNLYNQLIS